jgi:hypothetical protein
MSMISRGGYRLFSYLGQQCFPIQNTGFFAVKYRVLLIYSMSLFSDNEKRIVSEPPGAGRRTKQNE